MEVSDVRKSLLEYFNNNVRYVLVGNHNKDLGIDSDMDIAIEDLSDCIDHLYQFCGSLGLNLIIRNSSRMAFAFM